MGDLGNEFIIGIVSAAGGAVVLYGLQKIDTLRRVVTNSVKRIRDLVNHLRKFVLAKKNTRVQTRAHFISRRYNMSLATLELTLFRWFDKRAELLPFIQHVHKNHKHERVRDKAYELMWVEKSATALQIGDIVDGTDGRCLHALHIRRDVDRIRVLWDATPSSTSGQAFAEDAVLRVTRGGWCTNDDCRYCNMSPTLLREIGEWWWRKEEAEQESMRLKRGVRNFSVRSVEDAERALERLEAWEPVRVFYGKAPHAPSNHDGEPAISADSVANLKLLAEDGWEFQILRCEDYERLPRVIMFEWCPPPEG